ncbi:MAG: DUF883 domain-containing protein [Pseudomonadota bacterium]
MHGPEPKQHTQERLIGDLRQVIENAEELLKNTDRYTGTLHEGARTRLSAALETANEELARFEENQLLRMLEATRLANVRCNDRTGEEKLFRAFG